ncbi:glycyl-tRNA synthetase [Haloactinopolyspora alba]|uniref:Glycine--tRNA ligase n=1 Tax=Haloactinopolyspora alba TaxID=648780 RepID=A0A2P8EBZ7_9ACTN|nr:glycine--tRNA ligase [Haloactinopolyspora alba]PSL06957.1 glycyl-tRNA synthetase [Haloactinopolyspora alba]
MPAPVDAIVSLAKRRGFAYPSGEIYGATPSAWDYGPLGVELKENIRRQWWRSMVQQRDDVVGLDSAVILPPDVWAASGHVDEFVDPLTECRACRHRFRTDQIDDGPGPYDPARLALVPCPDCGAKDAWTEPRLYSGLLATRVGTGESGSGAGDGTHYLRPETSQGIFANVSNVMNSARRRPPFGIAQVGKAFRNEIAPGDFVFRTREFEQMEMAFFIEPGSEESWHEYWLQARWDWYVDLGIPVADLRLYEHPQESLAHYSTRTVDIEYRFGLGGDPDGFAELEGVANRGDLDLSRHAKRSGQDLSFFDQEKGERWVPYVIEPAAGLSRSVLAFLLDAYDVDEAPNARGGTDARTVLRLDPRLAPVKVAVLPLSRNAELSPRARELCRQLRERWNVEFDDSGAIGRRYRRQDEIGTPYCVTVDFASLDDGEVTVRERDTMGQERVGLDNVERYLAERLPTC